MDGEKNNCIGRAYGYMLKKIAKSYKAGDYVVEREILLKFGNSLENIACYPCMETIKGEHLRFDINGSKIRTHRSCAENLVEK